MSERIRLLVSARDPGAAGHLAEVAAYAREHPGVEPILVASPPALGAWQALDLAVEPFAAPPVDAADDPGVDLLLAEARALLERARPDAILVGLSGPGMGVDEALLAMAGYTPAFVLQDFWGDLNTLLYPVSATPLVMDNRAAAATRARHGLDSIVVGAPKYAPYADLDVPGLRVTGRRLLGAGDDRLVGGFCGQPLWSHAGYRDTVEALASALSGHLPDALLVYRPHPKEARAELAAVASVLASCAGNSAVTRAGDTETFLAACDVVCSAFSTCATDLLYLDRASPMPLANGVHLLFDPRLVALCRDWTELQTLPMVAAGLAIDIDGESGLANALAIAADPAAKERTWRRCREVLADPVSATARVIEAIEAAVESAR